MDENTGNWDKSIYSSHLIKQLEAFFHQKAISHMIQNHPSLTQSKESGKTTFMFHLIQHVQER